MTKQHKVHITTDTGDEDLDKQYSKSFAFRHGTPVKEQIAHIHKKLDLKGRKARSFQGLDEHIKDTWGSGSWMEREED